LERREWQEKKSVPSPILCRWSSDLVLAAAFVATAADEQSSATQGGDDSRRRQNADEVAPWDAQSSAAALCTHAALQVL
jgi:hypothetical protein